MTDHCRLLVWRRSHELAVRLHQVRIAGSRAPGLASQLRRAAASIPANLAEGAGSSSAAHFAHFVEIAIGSSREVENHLQFAQRLQALPPAVAAEALDQIVEIRKMLWGLLKYLRNTAHPVH